MLTAGCALITAGDHNKSSAYALVGGTVFRDPGFALPGATVVLTADPADKHFRQRKTMSDDRGEFAFRLPPVAAHYLVRVSEKGFAPQEKKAEVADPQERVDVNFILVPAAKEPR